MPEQSSRSVIYPVPSIAPRITAFFSDQVSSASRLVEQLILIRESNLHVVTADHRVEICAAVWACVEANLETSRLSSKDRDALAPTLLAALIPGWRRHCTEAPDPVAAVTHRAAYYLSDCDAPGLLPSARRIAETLLSTLGEQEPVGLRQLDR